MELRTLLEAIDRIDSIDEAPMPVAMPQDPKPTMSVNINAQGVDNMKEVLGLLSDIESHNKDVLTPMVKDEDPEMEAYANEPEKDIKDIDYMVNKLAGGMNRPKKTHDKVGGGDNPMQRISTADELEESIKEQLYKHLQEIKEK